MPSRPCTPDPSVVVPARPLAPSSRGRRFSSISSPAERAGSLAESGNGEQRRPARSACGRSGPTRMSYATRRACQPPSAGGRGRRVHGHPNDKIRMPSYAKGNYLDFLRHAATLDGHEAMPRSSRPRQGLFSRGSGFLVSFDAVGMSSRFRGCVFSARRLIEGDRMPTFFAQPAEDAIDRRSGRQRRAATRHQARRPPWFGGRARGRRPPGRFPPAATAASTSSEIDTA